jgi:hypothetical protein
MRFCCFGFLWLAGLVIAGEVILNDASFGSTFAAARLFLGAA